MSRFLRFFAFLLFASVSVPVFAAGYNCPTTMQYTSCASGYYMTKTTATTDKTYYGTVVSGNDCKLCNTLGTVSSTNGYTCPGGSGTAGEPTVTCAAGRYWSGSSCTTCTSGYECKGFSNVKLSSLSAGYGRTQCTGATYSNSGQSSCTPCPDGYTYNTSNGKNAIEKCIIKCPAGTRVAASGEGCTTPTGAWYINFEQLIGYTQTSPVFYCPTGYDENYTYTTPDAHDHLNDCYATIPGGYYVPKDHVMARYIRVYADQVEISGITEDRVFVSEIQAFAEYNNFENSYLYGMGGPVGDNLTSATDGDYDWWTNGNYAECLSAAGGCIWDMGSVRELRTIALSLVTYASLYTNLVISVSEDGNNWKEVHYFDTLKTAESTSSSEHLLFHLTGEPEACSAGTAKASHELIAHSTSSCSNCGAGKYSRTAGAASCSNCAIGSYSNGTRNTACTACQTGKTTTATGQSSCNANCSNTANVSTWYPAAWTTSNTVTNACTVGSCLTGYGMLSNACVANTYNVTLSAPNATTVGTTSVTATYNAAMPTPITLPKRTGYTFQGFFDAETGGTKYYNSDGTSAKTWNKTSNTTLHAQWIGNSTEVVFSKTGGTGGTEKVWARYGDPMPTITAPTRTGYTFDGYYYNSTKYYNADGTSAKNWDKEMVFSLSAKWIANTYTVTLSAPDATTTGTTSVVASYEQDMPSATMPKRNGWIFTGYFSATTGGIKYYNANGTSAKTWDKTSNTTLYAQWSQCNACATTNASCSMSVVNNTCTYDTTCNPGYGNIQNDGKYNASCTASVYLITFNKMGGTGGTDTVMAAFNQMPPGIEIPTKTASVFAGYYNSDTDFSVANRYYDLEGTGVQRFMFNNDVTFYARWADCTPCSATNANCSLSVVNNACTYTTSCKTGYGNITNNGKYNPSCTPNTYTVTLSAPDATTAGTASVTATYDAAMPNITVPSRNGYGFMGFFDATTGGTKYYEYNGTSFRTWNKTANSTLHGQWKAITYSITLNKNGGTGGSNTVAAQYDSEMPAITVPTRTGYTFNGYFSGSVKYYNADGTSARTWNITSHQTLNASWTANTYTVTLSAPGATTPGTTSVTATYGSAMPTATMPTKTGSNFTGYFDATTGGTQYYSATGASLRPWDKVSNTTLHAQWSTCTPCSPTNATCSVEVVDNVCTYTTSCKTGYGNIQNNGKYNPSCTANTYTVTFSSPGATTPGTASVTATYDAAMPTATMPTLADRVFAGYFDATTGGTQYYTAAGTSARTWNKTSNSVLYAQWNTCTPCSATNANCSVSVVNNVCTYTTICKTGYGNIQNNGKYNPSCTANKYTITFDRKYGTGGDLTVEATFGQPMPTAAMPSSNAAEFLGYYDSDDGTQYYSATGASLHNWDKAANKTLTSEWNACEPCYQYSVEGVLCSLSVVSNKCTYTTSCLTGYGNLENGGTAAATCTPNTYTINLNHGDGNSTGVPNSVNVLYYRSMPDLSAVPTHATKVFEGYYANASGGTKYYYSNGESAHIWDTASNGTIYAKWHTCSPCSTTNAHCVFSNANNKCNYTTTCFTGYGSILNDGTASASCTAKKYTVTLSAPDASQQGTSSVIATFDQQMPAAAMPHRTGWVFMGYYDAISGGTVYYNSNGTSARTWNIDSNTTLHAQWVQREVECSEGEYVAANELECRVCPIGSYCPGGTYGIDPDDQGINACPMGYRANMNSGLSEITECILSTSAGKYVETATGQETTCPVGHYCPGYIAINYGSTGGKTICPEGYRDNPNTGIQSIGQCSLKAVGKYVPTAYGQAVACPAGTASNTTYVMYGEVTSCPQCQGATYSASGAIQCFACPSGYNADTTNGKSSIDMCKIDVPSGSFIGSAGGSPSTCTSGSFCTGGMINYGDTGGIVQCPAGYTDGGTDLESINECAIQTTAGKYIATANSATQSDCEIGYYCPSTLINYGSVGGNTLCPAGYRNGNTGAKEIHYCLAKCEAGYFVDSARTECKPLTIDDSYTDEHFVSYGANTLIKLCNSEQGYHIIGKTNAADHAGIGSCYQTCAVENIDPPYGAVKVPKNTNEYYPQYCVYTASCPTGFNAIPDGDSYDSSGYTTDPYCESTKFNITFVANGGTMTGAGLSYSKECYGGMNCVLDDAPIASIQRTGFIFGGWAKTAGGPAIYQNGTNLLDLETENLNLYAVWETCQGGYSWNGSTCSICPIGTWMSPGTTASGALKYCTSCGGGNTTDAAGSSTILQCRPCTAGNYCGASGGQELSCSALGDGTWTESEPSARLQTECYVECPDYPVTYGTAIADNLTEFYPTKCNYTCISDTGNIGNVVGGRCVENQCNANYQMVNGVCQLCNVENALSYKPGTNCEVQNCVVGYHPQGQSCVENVQECSAPYADEAYRTWDNKNNTWGACTIKTCEPGYHVSSNACVADEQTCTVENGRGYREWDTVKNQWGECIVEYCNPGFSFDKSETNEHAKACGQCKNKFSVLGELAASSYIQGCEIATCMYQGELYNLEGNECVPICDVNGYSDETGTMKWNPSTKKCERKCFDGFTAW